MSNLAVVGVFAYRRPMHLRRVLSALANQDEARHTSLWIFVDGPRGRDDRAAVEKSRQIAHEARGFSEVHVMAAPKNLGLAHSIVQGVAKVLNQNDRVIVLEDDIVPLPGFLSFMNRALNLYENIDRVMQVSATQYADPPPADKRVRFLPVTTSWGWATWGRAWEHFQNNEASTREFLRSNQDWSSFDLQNSYPFRRLLEDSVSGRGDTWAVRWYYSCFIRSGLTVHPPISYVLNIGRDGSGQHDVGPCPSAFSPPDPAQLKWPEEIRTDFSLMSRIQEQFRLASGAPPSRKPRLWHWFIKKILPA